MNRRGKGESGQALLLVVVAVGILLIGATGLAIDAARLYGQSQMAQTAADAAAMAGIMSVFQGVNASGKSTDFSTAAAFNCSGVPNATPCRYAALNGFGGAGDSVDISFPVCNSSNPCGYEDKLSSDTPNQIQVDITRNVRNSLIRLLGAANLTQIRARAVAAVVTVQSPTPLLILHPTRPRSLEMGGGDVIRITGGPSRSIQVNSRASLANTPPDADNAFYANSASYLVDLSAASESGTGADFGVFGGPATQPSGSACGTSSAKGVCLGTTGKWVSPASPIEDPFLTMFPTDPSKPSYQAPTPKVHITSTSTPYNYGCPAGKQCTVYFPGYYDDARGGVAGGIDSSGIHPSDDYVIFQPGKYYLQGGGFTLKGNIAMMCDPSASGYTADPEGQTGNGMLIYNTGTSASPHVTAPFRILEGTDGSRLLGANASWNPSVAPTAPYYGLLFFQDRHITTPPQAHTIGKANGKFDLVGTIYITNPSNHGQTINYSGGPNSTTIYEGMVVTDVLSMQGNSTLQMGLNPMSYLFIRQVALVGGGPNRTL